MDGLRRPAAASWGGRRWRVVVESAGGRVVELGKGRSTRLKTAKLMISVAHPPACATEMYDSVAHQLEGCATEFGGLTF